MTPIETKGGSTCCFKREAVQIVSHRLCRCGGKKTICVAREVMGLNCAGCGLIFFLHCICLLVPSVVPGTKDPGLWNRDVLIWGRFGSI